MSPRFFGKSSQPLFGIFHPARGMRGGQATNVLLCPPIGHEYIRTHWAMRSLASKLAREGANVFRFDYRGTGDSSLDVSDVTTLQDWVADTCDAAIELLDTSTAEANALTIVGLRFGGVIAAMASAALEDNDVDSNVVLWEPTMNGADYLAELRTMHHRMIDLWTSRVETENSDTHEELLGFRLQKQLLAEIEQIDLISTNEQFAQSDAIVGAQQTIIDWQRRLEASNANSETATATEPIATKDEYDWDDLNCIEEAWLPAGATVELVRYVAPQNNAAKSRERSNAGQQTTGSKQKSGAN